MSIKEVIEGIELIDTKSDTNEEAYRVELDGVAFHVTLKNVKINMGSPDEPADFDFDIVSICAHDSGVDIQEFLSKEFSERISDAVVYKILGC